jgi:hypothetical protein
MGPPAEPCMKRHYLLAFHQAAQERWGTEGLLDIRTRMPPREAEEAFAGRVPAWVPERVPIAWCFALWEGRADRDRSRYVAWLHRVMDLSFGRVRRMLLGMAMPEKLFPMAHKLWSDDHTHGSLEGRCEDKRGVFVLRDHPYVDTPQARATIAENFRYSVQLTRARNVVETHARRVDGALEVKLRWL